VAAETSLLIERRGAVRLLKLIDSSGFPRLSRNVLGEIENAIAVLPRDDAVRGAVICGTAKCFAAGADLEEIAALDGAAAREFAELGQRVMRAINDSEKPVIAAVSGYCMGGGLDLALACRARIATDDAVFAHRGAALGIITGWGGTQRLPRLLGPRGKALAIELMTTGRTMDAAEAKDCGLVREVVTATDLVGAASLLVEHPGSRREFNRRG
jgi:enoyl-CoA hydratase/carnithine racemase